MNWQPIETAPKDGTRILVYVPPKEYYYVTIYIVLWIKSLNGFYLYYATGEDAQKDALVRNPTYWMPLPDPPK